MKFIKFWRVEEISDGSKISDAKLSFKAGFDDNEQLLLDGAVERSRLSLCCKNSKQDQVSNHNSEGLTVIHLESQKIGIMTFWSFLIPCRFEGFLPLRTNKHMTERYWIVFIFLKETENDVGIGNLYLLQGNMCEST
ncbi:hypothetical protein CAPTEDRAFT_207172 [Capitella teleta]|uniref:Uncharacterized protein n=1 Tax=Capitella teleta TaxID=283909 RepID=R7T7B9_CAPTE|nr:hypothetical protein CAPTEDRAFT_207172 [Capitella teleta]|eukprot:ELT89298.1 hypothetical protein CAPTEDRAFT_207172 [Capitella teleta]